MNTSFREKSRSLWIAVALSCALSLIKATGAFLCSSASLLASALDSLMDVGLSSLNLLSAWHASKPPDEGHAYGHEKIESLASYTQGVVFAVFSFGIFYASIWGAAYPAELAHGNFAILTVVLAMGVNMVIMGSIHQSQKKSGSLILKAEKAHYSMDLFSHLLVLVTLVLVRWTGRLFWDRVTGILLASYVLFSAVRLIIQSGNELVDRSLPSSVLRELDHIIRAHDVRISDYHEIRTRRVGEKFFIDFHLVLKSNQSFEKVHEITESLIDRIKIRFKNADVTIHEDPEERGDLN